MNLSKSSFKESITAELCEEDHPQNNLKHTMLSWWIKFISLLIFGNQRVQLSTPAIKNRHAMKMALLSFQVFIGNRSTVLLNSGCSALRASPTHFASSMSLERAVALVFCDSVLDWAFEFVFFEFAFFELELDRRLDVSRTSSSGIDSKLGMSVICELCIDENERLYHN